MPGVSGSLRKELPGMPGAAGGRWKDFAYRYARLQR
jgi:hypothetical protein